MAKRKIKVQSLADTGKVPSTKTKVAKAISFNKPSITPTGNALRDYWLAVMKVTGQVNITKGGLITATKKKASTEQLVTAWKLLAVPYHVTAKRYDRLAGVTSAGITFLSAGRVEPEEIAKFAETITAKKQPVGYQAI